MVTLYLQRLLARGAETLPDCCLIDVGSIARWLAEVDPPAGASSAWLTLCQAAQRSHRRFLWIESEPVEPPASFSRGDLIQASRTICRRLPGVNWIRSRESFASHARQLCHGGVAVVANVDGYREQLCVVDTCISRLLDIANGRVHSYVQEAVLFEPVFAPHIEAATRPDPADSHRRRPAGKRSADHKLKFERVLQAGQPLATARVPHDVHTPLVANAKRIDARTKKLAGGDIEDERARQTLRRAIVSAPSSAQAAASADPMVLLPLNPEPNAAVSLPPFCSLYVFEGGGRCSHRWQAKDVPGVLRDLVGRHPDRWVAPRALDLARYMIEHGVPLPVRLFDPALGVFALDPDEYVAGTGAFDDLGLPREEAEWLWDLERLTPRPKDVVHLARIAPELVGRIEQRLAQAQLTTLFRSDLEKFLPVLARIEANGATVTKHVSRRTAVLAHVQSRLDVLERAFRPVLGTLDPYRAKPDALVRQLNGRGLHVAPAFSAPYLRSGPMLKRLALQHARAKAVVSARSIVSLFPFLNVALQEPALRGLFAPQVAGRFGYHTHALNQLPKHFPEAKRLRGLLEPPAGQVLISADFSSFEARLVAGLSRDPVLLQAAQQPDMFMELAKHHFGSTAGPAERKEIKSYQHAFHYGQDERGFVSKQAHLSVADASLHYETLVAAFPGVAAWHAQVLASAQQSREVRTTGGWRRVLQPSWRGRRLQRIACSTTIQGLAADIFRWCLIKLDTELPQFGAAIVFENHDELFVAAPRARVSVVKSCLKRVMEQDVTNLSGLVPPGIVLKCDVKSGSNWGNLK